MLTITGQKYRFCDGLSRRGFLTVGGLAMGGATLPQILRAESQQGIKRSHKAIINVFLPGGPPHQDMWGWRCLLYWWLCQKCASQRFSALQTKSQDRHPAAPAAEIQAGYSLLW